MKFDPNKCYCDWRPTTGEDAKKDHGLGILGVAETPCEGDDNWIVKGETQEESCVKSGGIYHARGSATTVKDTKVEKAINSLVKSESDVQEAKEKLAKLKKSRGIPATVKPAPPPPEEEKEGDLFHIPENLKDFDEQCFLLEYAPTIHAHFTDPSMGPGHYTDHSQWVTSQHFGPPVRSLNKVTCLGEKYGTAKSSCWKTNIDYISKITVPPKAKLQKFFEITPSEKAQIIPFMQISLDEYTASNEFVKSTIFDFINSTPLDTDIFRSKGQRNLAGIKSLAINLDGVDTATSKIVTINAAFLFQDFRTIFKKRKDKRIKGKQFARTYYSDLFSYSVRRKTDKNNYRKLRFQLGWTAENTLRQALGLNRQMLVLDAQIVKYNFDFNPDGSVVVNITYKGLLETILDGPESNVLSLVKKTVSDMQAAQEAHTEETQGEIVKRATDQLNEQLVKKIAMDLFAKTFLGIVGNMAAGAPSWNTHLPEADAEKLKRKLYVSGGSKSNISEDDENVGVLRWRSTLHSGGVGVGLERSALSGDVGKLLQDAGVNLATAGERHDEIIKAVRKLYQQYFTVGATFKGGQHGQMTRTEFNTLMSQIQHKKGGMYADSAQAVKQAQDNLKDAGATAEQLALKALALVRFQGLRELARELLAKQCIYQAKLTKKQKYALNSSYLSLEDSKKVFEDLASSKATILSRRGADPTVSLTELHSGVYQLMPFVFFGDFLTALLSMPAEANSPDTVYELISDAYNERFKVDLGYIFYSTPFRGQTIKNFPLYYLPLSLVKLNNFFVRHIIGKELTFYSFKNFVMDLLGEFLRGAHNNCRSSAVTRNILVPNIEFVFGTTGLTKHMILRREVYEELGQAAQFKKSYDHRVWFLYGTQNVFNEIPADAFGKYLKNMDRQIFHFYLGGQDRGILNSIKLIDNTNPDLKAAIYLKTKSGDPTAVDGAQQALLPPLVYKIEIQTLGCSTFQLGQFVFLDAKQFVTDNIDQIFQISGYYRVYKVTHSATRDGFITTVMAILEESWYQYKQRTHANATADGVSATASSSNQGGKGTVAADPSDASLQKAADIMADRLNALQQGKLGLAVSNIIRIITTGHVPSETNPDIWVLAEGAEGWQKMTKALSYLSTEKTNYTEDDAILTALKQAYDKWLPTRPGQHTSAKVAFLGTVQHQLRQFALKRAPLSTEYNATGGQPLIVWIDTVLREQIADNDINQGILGKTAKEQYKIWKDIPIVKAAFKVIDAQNVVQEKKGAIEEAKKAAAEQQAAEQQEERLEKARAQITTMAQMVGSEFCAKIEGGSIHLPPADDPGVSAAYKQAAADYCAGK